MDLRVNRGSLCCHRTCPFPRPQRTRAP